ncbi:MAG: metal-dependent transcriptional regulator [Candidatus Omnitrophica bacterium]|nr:metal-dependent transcriptional regulator [Candidatus Omnitrophota bacterium]MBU1128362.1 metal-dependent transcriptional regulator [Candidatus Omnitrophota bacterium]MBU1656596.1 metal-dependent transcriptional regulator [Candidatus Omnitrophota bacterium]MBU1784867.1 metal-dependent transcriptional regulator [Candidatus Omnitrophota bacterium]MBU1850957.1 metal-dependent transcriptional regulator [Candidatus Omnitrophota bacterium]
MIPNETKKKKLSSNMEDYLETIYILDQKRETVRIKDISALMDVKKSSVNNAINVLSERELVRHEKYGYVVLTLEGRQLSKAIKKRHDLLVRFLGGILGVDEQTAVEDACRMEHVISSVTNDRLRKFIEFVDTCPTGEKPEWLNSLTYYIEKGKRPKTCTKKIKRK